MAARRRSKTWRETRCPRLRYRRPGRVCPQVTTPLGDQFIQPRANFEIAAIPAREITPGLTRGAVIGILPQAPIRKSRRYIRSEIKIPGHRRHTTAGCVTRSYSLFAMRLRRLRLPRSRASLRAMQSTQSLVAQGKSKGKRYLWLLGFPRGTLPSGKILGQF